MIQCDSKVLNIEKDTIPLDSNSVDVIECHYVLEHLNSLNHIIKEFHRLIKVTGVIKISLPHHTSSIAYHSDHKLYFRLYCFSEFDINFKNRCFTDYPKFSFKRKLIFPYWYSFLGYIFNNYYMQHLYENTGIRYLLPCDYIHIEMKKWQ